MRREFSFLLALWKANLLAAMEYRASFLTQIIGMTLNNIVYFLIWVIFFQQFKEVRGWGLDDMFLVFGIVAAGFGASVFLFGNLTRLAEVIVSGRLDYYLALPRPVLLHALASSSSASGLGDFTYGVVSFMVVAGLQPAYWLRFVVGTLLAMTVLISFLVAVQSLAFWIGSAQLLSAQAVNAMITFSIYPLTLFDGTAKLLLFTVVPAALVGAVPAEFVRGFSWLALARMLLGALVFLALALLLFRRGLRRYESGSAFQIQV